MNSNTEQKYIRILCFGDSNTWGYNPKDGTRYPEDIRWSGKLQMLLGNKYQIIEEGLNGRTTTFDYKERKGKNGYNYVIPCMDSHYPLNMAILCLGTNDTKKEFHKTAEEISDGLEKVVQIILGENLERPSPNIRLIIASPILIDENYIGEAKEFVGAQEKTKKISKLYEEISKKYSSIFEDLSKIALPSELDGYHMDEENHTKIANYFHKIIINENFKISGSLKSSRC